MLLYLGHWTDVLSRRLNLISIDDYLDRYRPDSHGLIHGQTIISFDPSGNSVTEVFAGWAGVLPTS